MTTLQRTVTVLIADNQEMTCRGIRNFLSQAPDCDIDLSKIIGVAKFDQLFLNFPNLPGSDPG
jgi:DNA-binding NarL/FixJ family response regulator